MKTLRITLDETIRTQQERSDYLNKLMAESPITNWTDYEINTMARYILLGALK